MVLTVHAVARQLLCQLVVVFKFCLNAPSPVASTSTVLSHHLLYHWHLKYCSAAKANNPKENDGHLTTNQRFLHGFVNPSGEIERNMFHVIRRAYVGRTYYGSCYCISEAFNRSQTDTRKTPQVYVVQSRKYSNGNPVPVIPAFCNGIFTRSKSSIYQNAHLKRRTEKRRWYIRPVITFDTSISVHDDHPLSEYISTNLTGCDDPSKDAEFNVCFLGTGGGSPSRERICSSTMLRVKGQCFLFDAGEGVQRQLMFTRTQAKSITQIFITHMHGDHIFGLPGLLLHLNTVATSKYREKQEPFAVALYGPPGLYNYVAMTLTLSMTASTAVSIVVHELVGSEADPEPTIDEGRQHRQARRANYKEIGRRNLQRKAIPRNNDGTWTIAKPPQDAASSDARLKKVFISAAEVWHVKGVATFGYTVTEQTPQPNIDVEKATACGVAPGPKYRLLRMGTSVESDDRKRIVHPHEVLVHESARNKGRKFALVGDNYQLSPAMYTLCQGCDVLVHEATLVGGECGEPAIERGHSSPESAGQVALDVNAGVLILNHMSGKVNFDEVDDIKHRAETTNMNRSSIVVAHDFMNLSVPVSGFHFAQTQVEGEEKPVDEICNNL